MRGRLVLLGVVLQLLEELLAGPESRDPHLDVDVGPEAAEADELAGDIDDPHGLAQIQDEDLAAHAERLSGKMLVSLTKGIEAHTFKLMSQILEDIAPQARIGVLSGPNLAREIAEHALTATVVASEDEDGDQNFHTLRGQLLFEPTDTLDINIIADFTSREENCCTGVTVVRGGTAAIIAGMAEAIEAGQAEGSLPVQGDAKALAQSLYQLWLGASIMVKIVRTPQPFANALRTTRHLLGLPR